MPLPSNSLSTKIVLLIAIIVTLTAAILAVSNQVYMRKFAHEKSIAQLSRAVESIAPDVQAAFNEMIQDLELIQFTTPVQGIVRSTQNNGKDPYDGSDYEAWRHRLETLFESILGARSAYTQIRFIGLADNGREIARVDRRDGKIVTVPPGELQSKGDRDYFQAALTLNPGEFSLSDVTLNVEQGKIEPDARPTVRAITPVYTAEGELFGFIAINEIFEALALAALGKFDPSWHISLLAYDGSYYTVSQQTHTGELHFSGEHNYFMPEQLRRVQSEPGPFGSIITTVEGVQSVSHYFDVLVGRQPQQKNIRVVATVPTEKLFVQADYLIRVNLWISGILALLACAIGMILGRRVTNPLMELDKSIQRFGTDGMFTGDLDAGFNYSQTLRGDEIGKIAQSFHNLSVDLANARESEKTTLMQLEAVIEQSIDSIVTIDAKGIVQTINPAGERMFEYPADELIGQSVTLILPKYDAGGQDLYLTGIHGTGEHQIVGSTSETDGKTRHGRAINLEMSVSEVITPNGDFMYCALLRDITGRRLAQERLEKYALELGQTNADLNRINERLDMANSDLRSFTYIVSHDLRAPLVNLQGFSSQLNKRMQELRTRLQSFGIDKSDEDLIEILEVKIPKALNYIGMSATKMQGQLDSILELSRLGHYELDPKPINLSKLFTSIFEALLGESWKQTVTLKLAGLPDLIVDPKAIQIIANNFSSNAIKYQSKDRDLEITVTGEQREDGTVLCVEDNGRGMTADDTKEVFKLFRRCGRPDTEGEGIGLTYTMALVTRLGGRIWCESTLDTGSKFYVLIPYANIDSSSEAA